MSAPKEEPRIPPPPLAAFREAIEGWENAVEAVGKAQLGVRINKNLGTLLALRRATLALEEAVMMLSIVVPAAMAAERESIAGQMEKCAVVIGEVN